jgi:phosphoethanolamine N-methyltransferase
MTYAFWSRKQANLCSMFLGPAASIDLLEKKEVLSYLPDFSGKKVLDLACGIGRFTGEFAKKAEHVTALDFCPQFIEANRQANSDFSNIEYTCLNAMDANYPEQSFDLIFVSWLFLYLRDEEVEILKERLVRWLKPGGHLFFRESCAPVRMKNPDPDYFAIYRPPLYYNRLFEKKLTVALQGNILAFEDFYADPFKCFWLYQKSFPSSSAAFGR